MDFTEEQISSLAPDASALKSGKDLANAGKWQQLGAGTKAIWGFCQGSGKLPYQTQVDLLNIAFKCSCPSRKFPCKHGLGLMLLYIKQEKSFDRGNEPDWVIDWLSKRVEKAEKKEQQKDKPVDEAAQQKRIETRTRNIAEGIDELQFWLKDLIRTGLLTVPERANEFWRSPAKRLIDAQAPGLASKIKGLGSINYYNDNWKYSLLSELSSLYVSGEAYKNIETLPDDFRNEIKTRVGWTQAKEELLVQQGIADDWMVLNRTYTEDEQLTTERNWLYGINTRRFALILQFFIGTQVPELNLLPGSAVNGELVFYKGLNTYRALMKKQNRVQQISQHIKGNSIIKAYEYFNQELTANPLQERIPVALENTRLHKEGREAILIDEEKNCIKLQCSPEVEYKLLAVSGGKPAVFFILMNECDAQVLAIQHDNKFHSV